MPGTKKIRGYYKRITRRFKKEVEAIGTNKAKV